MRRRHQANVSVEGLESKIALSGITSTVAFHHHAVVAEVTQLAGSLKGAYVASPGATVSAAASVQLKGSGMVSPLGLVSAEGQITAAGGQLTLHGTQTNVAETCILTPRTVVSSGTDVVETFSYKTTDGLFAGTFVLDLHPQSASANAASQLGTFDAKFD
jgi:hypothetical protein